MSTFDRKRATKGLAERAPRGRMYAVTHLNYVSGPTVAAVVSSQRHEMLAAAVREAEGIDHRLNPQIILTEKED